MARTLRVLARLLSYPDAALRAHLPELAGALRDEGALRPARLEALEALIESLARQDALDAEADHVQLFDSGRRTSLHLFEHVHGDSRDRGPAMVDLARTFEAAGLHLAEGEMPDHLPVVLEYASTQPAAQAQAFLAEIAHILQAICSALVQRRSHHAAALAALIELAGEEVAAQPVADEAPVDDTWQEPEAFSGCASSGQARPGGAGQPQAMQFIRKPAARAARGAQP